MSENQASAPRESLNGISIKSAANGGHIVTHNFTSKPMTYTFTNAADTLNHLKDHLTSSYNKLRGAYKEVHGLVTGDEKEAVGGAAAVTK